MRVGLIDYGSGNLTSVRHALERIEAPLTVVSKVEEMAAVSHLVLPGVGAFHGAMQRLHAQGFVEAIREQVGVYGKPLLGICVGMQVLADSGVEFEPCEGLGLIRGDVRLLEVRRDGERLPHIGWNDVTFQHRCPLFEGMKTPTFYFLHSYSFDVTDPDDCMASCDYASGVTACVQHENVYGVQFHPEKSQEDGLRVLRNFAGVTAPRELAG